MDSITAMNKKNVQWMLEERARTQKFINRNTSATTNRSQSPDRIALAGPPFPWIPAPDVRLRLKMAFRTLTEYNDLREEALASLNPRPQCVRKLYILVKKHYHPSA
ncbi:hypothetical protein KI688_012639 [Linnemannia hyalina]|uniref:Uncharacterized protein n=1 Tax=Linnemannia hyalina TaxID=64524 RepID=A0A9P8BSP1_9FUNG|nr:hypothetical protein KI688_012639 [Linnemannia hyalina]